MKKKVLGALLSATLVVSMLAGCGGNNSTPSSAASGNSGSNSEASQGGQSGEEGSVLNIYCWNDEFRVRVANLYPGYTKVDDTHGTIGDVSVVWHETPNKDNAYQNNLDQALMNQSSAAADDKIDMFLAEADYILKYTDSDYTMPIADLGITDADIADQYTYTQDVASANGVLKGLSWQGCPGVLFYNREAAKEVLGTDDPAEVQKYVKDWETFNQTAKTLKEKGYKIVASVNDTFRTYSNNVSSPWVVDNKIVIDDNIKKWVDDSKELVDAGCAGTYDLWSDDWSAGFYPEGKVFCYFGPAWLVNFSMSADQPGSIGYEGGWGATEGPQGFFWGGTWICAATGTDNPSLVKDIMLKMTADEEIMTSIVTKYDDFVNNKPAMEALASGEKKVPEVDENGKETGNEVEYSSKILGGQNPLPMYCNGVNNLDLSNMSAYDQGCNEQFQNAMKNYFEGSATYEEALELFYKAVEEKYPELSH